MASRRGKPATFSGVPFETFGITLDERDARRVDSNELFNPRVGPKE
jgi:hypothetical protein